MKNKFKAGDRVVRTGISVGRVLQGRVYEISEVFPLLHDRFGINIEGHEYDDNIRFQYYSEGFELYDDALSPPEATKALVTLHGEGAVPELPLSPQEITLKLLENQKYQLCRVSNHSTDWKHNKNLKAIVHIGVFGEFLDSNGEGWTYGIPIDNNGNEITEIE